MRSPAEIPKPDDLSKPVEVQKQSSEIPNPSSMSFNLQVIQCFCDSNRRLSTRIDPGSVKVRTDLIKKYIDVINIVEYEQIENSEVTFKRQREMDNAESRWQNDNSRNCCKNN